MAKPEYVFDLAAITPLSEIIPNLYQGMRPGSYVGYDLVVSCEQHLAKGPMSEYQGMLIHVPMRDEDDFLIPELDIAAAAAVASEFLEAGKKVLVHCTGGLNRSSLVTAAVLIMDEYSPSEAIAVIRAKRDRYCLNNRAFERWILGEQLPTAETTTFTPIYNNE